MDDSVEVVRLRVVRKAEGGLTVLRLEHVEAGGGGQVHHLQVQLLLPHLTERVHHCSYPHANAPNFMLKK